MRWLLDLGYLLALALLSPYLIHRRLKRGGASGSGGGGGWLLRAAGRAPRRVSTSPCVWFHAVSVGEVLLLRPIVAEWSRRRPDWEIVISTTSESGLSVARSTFPELVTFHAPLDFSWAVAEALDRIKPQLLVLVELELWPNFIAEAERRGVKVAVINARMSPNSFRGYRRFRWALASTLRRIAVVAAQTEEYADRFRALGLPADRVEVTGSVKFDNLPTQRDLPATRGLRTLLGLRACDHVFVAGSTMEGEEEEALRAYRAARADHPTLRLIVVPRHPHRFDEVARLIESQGETVAHRSRLTTPADLATRMEAGRPPIILVDTLGELGAVWGLADVAFVGGSLFPGRGGQNMMEPAAFGATVLFGPHTVNFKATVEALLSRDAARVVRDGDELRAALSVGLTDPDSAAVRGERARRVVGAPRGATARAVDCLERLAPLTPRSKRPATPHFGGPSGSVSRSFNAPASTTSLASESS